VEPAFPICRAGLAATGCGEASFNAGILSEDLLVHVVVPGCGASGRVASCNVIDSGEDESLLFLWHGQAIARLVGDDHISDIEGLPDAAGGAGGDGLLERGVGARTDDSLEKHCGGGGLDLGMELALEAD
jgi:hypothetical protein